MATSGMYFNYERRLVRIYKPRCKAKEGITRLSILEFAFICGRQGRTLPPPVVATWDIAEDNK